MYHLPEPPRKRRWLPQLIELLPYRNKSRLGGILGKMKILHHRIGACKGHVLKQMHKAFKGFVLFTERRLLVEYPCDERLNWGCRKNLFLHCYLIRGINHGKLYRFFWGTNCALRAPSYVPPGPV